MSKPPTQVLSVRIRSEVHDFIYNELAVSPREFIESIVDRMIEKAGKNLEEEKLAAAIHAKAKKKPRPEKPSQQEKMVSAKNKKDAENEPKPVPDKTWGSEQEAAFYGE